MNLRTRKRPTPVPADADAFVVGEGPCALTVSRRGKKGGFTAEYQKNGHKRKSLKTASRKIAEQRAWKFYDDLIQDRVEVPIRPVPLNEALDLYIKFVESLGRRGPTVDAVREKCETFSKYLNAEGIKTVGQVTLLAVDRYIQSRSDVARSTRRTYSFAIKKWFGFLAKRKLVKENPLADMEHPKSQHVQYPPVRPSQLEAILGAATDELHDLLLTLAFTGLRSAEATHLLIRNVDFANGVVLVRNTEIHTLKNGNAVRDIPIHRNLRPVLLKAIGERHNGRVFIKPAPSLKAGRPNSVAAWKGKLLNDWFTSIARSLGLPTGLKHMGLTVNALRRYFKTTARDELLPESLVDRWCGHAIAGMDKHYYDTNKAQELMDKLPFGDWPEKGVSTPTP